MRAVLSAVPNELPIRGTMQMSTKTFSESTLLRTKLTDIADSQHPTSLCKIWICSLPRKILDFGIGGPGGPHPPPPAATSFVVSFVLALNNVNVIAVTTILVLHVNVIGQHVPRKSCCMFPHDQCAGGLGALRQPQGSREVWRAPSPSIPKSKSCRGRKNLLGVHALYSSVHYNALCKAVRNKTIQCRTMQSATLSVLSEVGGTCCLEIRRSGTDALPWWCRLRCAHRWPLLLGCGLRQLLLKSFCAGSCPNNW